MNQYDLISCLFRYARKTELLRYHDSVSSMDGAELGLTLALAANFRNSYLKTTGIDLADPFAAIAIHPALLSELSSMLVTYEQKNESLKVASLSLWVHTVRAASDLHLRSYGIDLWCEVGRGISHVAEAAENFYLTQREELDLSGVTEFPVGFTPQSTETEKIRC